MEHPEKFNLIFNGQFARHIGQEEQAPLLKRLKFSGAALEKVTQGKPLVIKKQLSRDAAQQWKKKLEGLGVITHLRLALNPLCLEAGWQNVQQVKRSTPPSMHFFERTLGSPLIARFNKSNAVVNKSRRKELEFHLYTPRMNVFFLLVFSAFTGLSLEFYGLTFISQRFGSSAIISILGVLFLLLYILFFIKLFKPLISFTVYNMNDRSRLHVVEKFNFNVKQSHFNVYDLNETLCGSIVRSKTDLCWKDLQGNTLMRWDVKYKSSYDSLQSAKDVYSSVIEETFLGNIVEYFEYFSKFLSFFRSRKASVGLDWDSTTGVPVIGENDQPLAMTYHDPDFAFMHIDRSSDIKAIAAITYIMSEGVPL